MQGTQPRGPDVATPPGPGSWRHAGIALLAALAWPLASHLAVVAGRADLLPPITSAALLLVLSVAAIRATRLGSRIVLVTAMLGIAVMSWFAPAALAFVAPAAIAVAAGLWFALSLLPGREPRIAVFARREHGGDLPPEVASYARRLTWVWAVLLFSLAAAGLALAVFAPMAVWSAYTNIASYVIMGAFFVAEYLWRRFRFPSRRHASFVQHLRNVIDR